MFLKHFTQNSISAVTLDIIPICHISLCLIRTLWHSLCLSFLPGIHYDILDALVEELGTKQACIIIIFFLKQPVFSIWSLVLLLYFVGVFVCMWIIFLNKKPASIF